MKKSRALKDFEWTVYINQRNVGFPNFYWEATSERYKVTGNVIYKNAKNARDGWTEFARAEEIKKFEVV
jgi:hypothetical protein